MYKNLRSTFVFLAIASFASAQTRYIAVTGTDIANDCSIPGNPCATIAYAVSQAIDGDTIMVASGTYAFTSTQLIDKSLVVMGQDSLIKPVITVAASDVIQITADSVTISNLRIEMGLTAGSGLKGIVANGNYDGLVIDDNEIISTKPLSFGMVFSSYAILASGGTGQMVTISNNVIQPLDSARDAHGRGLGIGLNGTPGPGANISGNTIRAFYPMQAIQNTGNLVCDDNLFSGNVLITYPSAGTSATFTFNTFDAYNDQIANNLTSLLEIRAYGNNASALVQGNEFINYKNIGLFSSASRNITVIDNQFTPSDIATDFISLFANTKLFTAGTQNTNYSNQIAIKGNTFDAGIDSAGAAIAFADHYGVTTPAFEDTIKVGGPNFTDKNTFDTNLKYFIALDSLSGPSNNVSLWSSYSISTMVPFSQSVYALATYNAYNISDTVELEEKMLDSLEVVGLGKVILFDSLIVTKVNDYDVLTINVYPNPSQSFITVQSNELKGLTQISIFNLEGKLVLNTQQNVLNNQITVPINQFAQGQYFMLLKSEKTLYHSKFVKE